MTEAEWQAGQAPERMVELVVDKASRRKLRLFAVACCREIWPALQDKRSRRAVEALEQFADGTVSEMVLVRATDEASLAVSDAEDAFLEARHAYQAETGWGGCSCEDCVARWIAQMDELNPRNDPNLGYDLLNMQIAAEGACAVAWFAHQVAHNYRSAWGVANRTVRGAPPIQRGRLLHELFGNPFRPAVIDPGWRTWEGGTVVGLAQAIYAENAFDHLPVLADALEEVGCADEGLLRHLRQPGGHLRGCWALDAVLGRN